MIIFGTLLTGASYRDKAMPLMHHETISVYTKNKKYIDMEAMREAPRTPGATRKFSTSKHRGKRGKDIYWEPHEGGSWRSSVIQKQRLISSNKDQKIPIGVKPVELMYELLAGYGGPVFDGFMGSGTTAVACQRLDLPFVGVEVDRDIFETACARVREGADDLFAGAGR